VKREIDTGTYDPATGLSLSWTPGFTIEVTHDSGEVLIRANSAGLTSLAQHLLTLAAEPVPDGTHIHLDIYGGLEDGSVDLILERRD
jgi:hypothetical protein